MANEIIKYVSTFGDVELTADTVKQYLVNGDGKVTDQEVMLFMKLCQAQKLNPFTQECYLIKFGNSPAQNVVGRNAYLRRADENPNFLGFKSGIVVQRGEDIVQKEGTCLYPSETLLGGWCRVRRLRNGEREDEVYKEVSLEEYDKGQSNWKTKKTLMICKVAESQALRAAFPKDYQGLYTAEEVQGGDSEMDIIHSGAVATEIHDEVVYISQKQRQEFFDLATGFYGKKKGNAVVKYICNNIGLESTTNMTVEQFDEAMTTLKNGIEADKKKVAQEGTESETDHE